jgi:hypothetical protein
MIDDSISNLSVSQPSRHMRAGHLCLEPSDVGVEQPPAVRKVGDGGQSGEQLLLDIGDAQRVREVRADGRQELLGLQRCLGRVEPLRVVQRYRERLHASRRARRIRVVQRLNLQESSRLLKGPLISAL